MAPPVVVQTTSDEDFEKLKAKLWAFMKAEIYPNETLFMKQCKEIGEAGNEWTHAPVLVELKRKARAAGLWNLFLPNDSARLGRVPAGLRPAGGLTNRQYGELCEILGTSCPFEFAAQATNTSSPDTGNCEVLARYGTPEQQKRWLYPLLEGKIQSCYAMTEPGYDNQKGSSDATNMSIEVARDEARQEYVINGQKIWITGAGSLHCEIMILMGKTAPQAPRHKQTSQILVPMNTPGITLQRPMEAFGENDAPKGHMEILFEDVRVPFSNVVLGDGRGFEISQGRLGPGRIHHCMRAIGQAERCVAAVADRLESRVVFGKKLAQFDNQLQNLAEMRAKIETCRLLVLKAASLMDEFGNKDAYTRQLLSLVKAHVPRSVASVADEAMQIHGARGFSQDTPLFAAFAGARWLRMADGPDEVHLRTVAKIELKRQKDSPLRGLGGFPIDRTAVFRRSTDKISPQAKALLEQYSKL
eukprot:TRINITY_DN16205_c0_g1_i1.p1 TRINITY_DN16205_c0_g1~~TRINITY_DN16205_c0_g1_i1.p1  ORF type:complete len:472 (+),score=176.04 TRINITY_DN16205_c0_g1_i1:69-1484(+)